MSAQADHAAAFHTLHRPGSPLVLFNAWDAGSAKAVVEAGALAVATGSASVGGAFGFGDGHAVPLDLVIENSARIVAAVDVPVSIDFEGGYAVEPVVLAQNFARLLASGAVGCNFEDQVVGGDGMHTIGVQSARLTAMRDAATAAGVNAFINARSDIFLQAPAEQHSAALVDEALARGRAYADAGANGLFLPGLVDDALIARACEASRLPVNIMMMPGVPVKARLAELGVARISHGPGPWRLAMRAFRDAATSAMAAP
jgi:2-methylisocitrate lyase-like PEP mutase family enzyme